MALITCPDCGGKLSDKAQSCPHCGCPVNSPSYPTAKAKLVFVPGLVQPIEGIKIDKKSRTFSTGFWDGIHSFDEIDHVDIFENGCAIAQTSTASIIGRGIVGAAFSPIGSIVGGATAKRKMFELVTSLDIFVFLNNPNKPLLKITMKIPKNLKKGSKAYERVIRKAESIKQAIENLE